MHSSTTPEFWKYYASLPASVQNLAVKVYALWRKDPTHPSLHFKQVSSTTPIYSVRIGLRYRALGARDDQGIVWFWIGSHADYDRLLRG